MHQTSMAATLYHFPSFNSLHPYKLVFLNQRKQQELRLGWYSQQNPPHKRCRFRVPSRKSSRQVKDNAELCKEIREFMAVVGLPESHVPTMKDFSQHGRSDLAYIVRRRGYKLIGELLASTIETDAEGFIMEKGETENNDAVDDDGEVEDENVSVVFGDFPSSVEASVVGNCSGSLVLGTNTESDDYSHVPVEGLEGYNEKTCDINEDGSLANEVSCMENHFASSSITSVFDSENHIQEEKPGPVEASLYSLEVDSEKGQLASSNISSGFNSCIHNQDSDLTGGDGMLNTAVDSVDSLQEKILQNSQIEDNSKAEGFTLENDTLMAEKHLSSSNMEEAFNSDEHSSVPVDLSALSLEEKVANFIHYGQLDTVEDNSSGILSETDTEESHGYTECVYTDEVQSAASTSEHSENVLNGENAAIILNGNTTKFTQVVSALAGNDPPRDENLSTEEECNQLNNNWDIKITIQKGKPVGISELKLMLYQKEQKLSRLKEQIEKQKNDLSVLQAKTETEISKAQKLIFEKDAELQAAEETLSGLVEVEIKYCGDGEIVEVTGSFNGWHNCIKMDLDPQSTSTDPSEPSKSKLWSTVLCLYPGVYEIKFIIDGHWKIDPEKESVTHGDICNNILRVEG